MPEGHTIHRLALDLAEDLRGLPVELSSPQGALADPATPAGRAGVAAEVLGGTVLEQADAYGKHLLLRFEGRRTLHIHLGLFGRFRRKRAPLQAPRDTCRLRLAAPDGAVAWDLSGAINSELLDRAGEKLLRARLGPDPLRARARPDAFLAALDRRRIPIGAALLDQAVIAGVGNVYRAEALFATGIDPHRPARELDEAERLALWAVLRRQLRDGVRMRRIVTRPAAEAPRPLSKLRRDQATMVYHVAGVSPVRDADPHRRDGRAHAVLVPNVPAVDPADELLDVLDAHGAPTGATKARAAVHRDGDWHRATHLWVATADGVLLQRRSARKAAWPRKLDATAAGHVGAGEEPLAAGLREAEEELGVRVAPGDVRVLGTFPLDDRPPRGRSTATTSSSCSRATTGRSPPGPRASIATSSTGSSGSAATPSPRSPWARRRVRGPAGPSPSTGRWPTWPSSATRSCARPTCPRSSPRSRADGPPGRRPPSARAGPARGDRDTHAALGAERGEDPDVDRVTRGTLHALQDELAALRGGDGPPLGARPTNGWTPRDAWLARVSEATAARLGEPGALATLQAVEREREARGA